MYRFVQRQYRRFWTYLPLAMTMVLLPSPAFAADCSGGPTGFDVGSITTMLQYLANLFGSVWLKAALVIAIVIAFLMLMFDGGQLPGIVKFILSSFIAVALILAILSWIVNASSTACIS